jgi:hypothetical protein
VLHAALAFAGAWRLLRRLGCDPPAAGLGAMGFASSPWFLPLAHTFTSLCGTAWLPWILAAGDRAIAGAGAARWRATLLAAALLALQFLAGEPVPVLVSGLALGCLALGAPRALPRALPRLLVVALLAALLAAVQLVPTAVRLSGSARGASVAPDEAGLWSARPARLVDFVLPRFWGDAMRDESGLWLGWNVHDRAYPFPHALNGDNDLMATPGPRSAVGCSLPRASRIDGRCDCSVRGTSASSWFRGRGRRARPIR